MSLPGLGGGMRRRDFLGALSGAVAQLPFAARAQQPTPTIGFLNSASAEPNAYLLEAFRQGLKDEGFIEGRNVAIEFRWADNQIDRLPALAADLVQARVAAIFAGGGGITARAAKAATSTIPIVFSNGEDPVKVGLVSSLNRPGANLTGSSFFTIELGPKRLDILRELVPRARTIALLLNPNSANADNQVGANLLESEIRARGQQLIIAQVSRDGNFGQAFELIKRQGADALLVISDPFFTTRRDEIVGLAAKNAIATIYHLREYVTAGGLVSYGVSITDTYRQSGNYIGQVLKGAKPAELPVLLPARFELVINMKAAKALGLEVPPKLLFTADEVIE